MKTMTATTYKCYSTYAKTQRKVGHIFTWRAPLQEMHAKWHLEAQE